MIGGDKKGPLFRSIGKGDRLSEKVMSRFDVLHMIKRRANAALPYSTWTLQLNAQVSSWALQTALDGGGVGFVG